MLGGAMLGGAMLERGREGRVAGRSGHYVSSCLTAGHHDHGRPLSRPPGREGLLVQAAGRAAAAAQRRAFAEHGSGCAAEQQSQGAASAKQKAANLPSPLNSGN